MANPSSQVHVAILRKAAPGQEQAFEEAVVAFIAQSAAFPGVLGALLIKPPPGDGCREYGILRSFDSAASRDAFYDSDMFRQWEIDARHLMSEDYERRDLHGLEAFFRGIGAPPRWKMAVLTWLAVYPSVLFWSYALTPVLSAVPRMLATGIVSVFVVITLAWGLMPWITRLFKPWLQPKPGYSRN